MKSQINKYPNTLFNLVKQNGMLDEITRELEQIKYFYKHVPTFKLLFETKRINQEQKKQILKNVLIGFTPLVSEFLSILIDSKMSKNLIGIINKFLSLSKKELYANEIEVITVNQPDENLINELSSKLNCTIKTKIDKSMIGGIKLRRGNKIFDNSISYQLEKLKKTLYNL